MRNKYTKEEIEIAVKKSVSFSDVFRNLNVKINGGSFKWIKNLISKFEIDISHFIPQNELRKQNLKKGLNKIINEVYATDDFSKGKYRAKAAPLRNFLLFNNRKEECCFCHLEKWLDEPIRLDIDHIDGDCYNNKLDNLQFICPNCHRQKTIKMKKETETFSIKYKRNIDVVNKIRNKCIQCDSNISDEASRCARCSGKIHQKIDWPLPEKIQEMMWEFPLMEIGKALNVSDNAVRKFARKHQLIIPTPSYRRYRVLGNTEKYQEIKQSLLSRT